MRVGTEGGEMLPFTVRLQARTFPGMIVAIRRAFWVPANRIASAGAEGAAPEAPPPALVDAGGTIGVAITEARSTPALLENRADAKGRGMRRKKGASVA